MGIRRGERHLQRQEQRSRHPQAASAKACIAWEVASGMVNVVKVRQLQGQIAKAMAKAKAPSQVYGETRRQKQQDQMQM